MAQDHYSGPLGSAFLAKNSCYILMHRYLYIKHIKKRKTYSISK